jgi:hypothetical protein
MDITDLVFKFLNLLLYGFSIAVFVFVIKFILEKIAPIILTGKANLRFYISLGVGGFIVLTLLAFTPYYVAKALLYGWQQFMPVMVEGMNLIIEDMNNVMSGNMPVYIPQTNYTVTTPVTPPPVPTPGPHMGGANLDHSAYEVQPQFDPNTWDPSMPVPTPPG